MKRIVILSFAVLFSLQLFAQDGSINPYDKRWSLKAGAGYFFDGFSIETRKGFSTWWAASYSLPSRLEFSAKLAYCEANRWLSEEEIEMLWPSDGGFSYRERERWLDVDYFCELGVSYPFIIGGRHRIAPGLGAMLLFSGSWRPTHERAVPSESSQKYLGVIGGSEFSKMYADLNFSFQLEYTCHFKNGFFVGLHGHLFHDLSDIEGVTISPVIGVRF